MYPARKNTGPPPSIPFFLLQLKRQTADKDQQCQNINHRNDEAHQVLQIIMVLQILVHGFQSETAGKIINELSYIIPELRCHDMPTNGWSGSTKIAATINGKQ